MGSIPLFSSRFKESPMALSVANAFSGGVFLAIALMHIMPEQSESYNGLHEGEDNVFPLPYFYLCIGYTIILVMDKVLFDTHVILGDHDHGDGHKESVAEKLVKKSIAEIISNSVHGGNLRESQIRIE